MTTTNEDLYVALQELNKLFEKASGILQNLSEPARQALLSRHGEDNNLIHSVLWGCVNSADLIDEIKRIDVIFDADKQEIIDIKKPYKSDQFYFYFVGDDNHNSKIVYVSECEDDVFNASYTSANFVGIVENLVDENTDKDEIERMAAKLWESCEWQDPEVLIDELGIDFFREDHSEAAGLG